MNSSRATFFFLVILLFASCASNEIGQSKDVNQETIYQQYLLEYDEGAKMAEMTAQFRFAGEDGTTLVLNNPSKLEYDGVIVPVDSSDFSGAFYKHTIPIEKVAGKHTLVFTDITDKKFQNIFSIDSFYLHPVTEPLSRLLPATIKFKAPPLNREDHIEISSSSTDSSFTIEHNASKTEDYITIPAAELQRQQQNEISITVTLYRKLPLQQQNKQGGEIITIQTLKPVKLQLKKEIL